MARSRVRAAAAATLVLLLSGCGGQGDEVGQAPTPEPSPSTTYLCVPELGGDPAPCSAEEYTEMERLNVLYTEAETTYRAFYAEYARLYRTGGTREVNETLRTTTGGPYQEQIMTQLGRVRDLEVKARGGDFKLLRVARSSGAPARGYEVALETCVDGRTVEVVQGTNVVQAGIVYSEIAYFRRDEGLLKIWAAEGRRVESC